MSTLRLFVGLLGLLFLNSTLWSQAHPLAPALSSRPGAAYTMYLNFSGFDYPGTWGGQTPGVTPAYNGQTGTTFTTTEQANIKNIWSRVAQAYAIFDINVTTVDPAVAAGQAANDLARYNYYQNTPRLMHTVIGNGASTFYGSAGGVSYVNVMHDAATFSGAHTNWAFVNRLGGVTAFHNIFTASAHELGHAASLSHQGDYIGSSRVNEYSTNNGSSTIAPTIGVAYGAARSVWRVGRVNTDVNYVQNDVLSILVNNPALNGYVNDGIGRTLATATPLPLIGGSIDFSSTNGIIVPQSTSNPNPIGESNYTSGYFSFYTTGGNSIINLRSGTQYITPGVNDPDSSLDGTLRILDAFGNPIAVAATSSLHETLNVNLAAGNYYIQVSSAGGQQASLGPNGNWAPAQFFDLGSYFLTGSIAVPEPAILAALGATSMGVGFWWMRRRKRLALERILR
ncbi:MAG: pre-peptidase C-terminal domain-containing protein [Planctomycetia bacterium]|nr:pre-peptidase C-terminal domain-containing protein [Planctomycetia bacterium]